MGPPHQIIIGPPDTGKEKLLLSLPGFEDALFLNLENHALTKELNKNSNSLEEILKNLKPNENLAIHRIDYIHKKYRDLLNDFFHRKDLLIIATSNSAQLSISPSYYTPRFTSSLLYLKNQTGIDLKSVLSYGLLPKVFNLLQNSEKETYLRNYIESYIRDEFIENSKIRNLVAFHLFLGLASDMTNEPLNFTQIAQLLKVDYKTVQNFYDLLIQTQTGFYLNSSDLNIRKVQKTSPKFYFFDSGFQRTIQNKLSSSLALFSKDYQQAYKNFCIAEVHKMNQLLDLKHKLSYIETKDGVGVDLVIETQKKEIYFVCFVGASSVLPSDFRPLVRFKKDFPSAQNFLVTEAAHQPEIETISIKSTISFLNLLDKL